MFSSNNENKFIAIIDANLLKEKLIIVFWIMLPIAILLFNITYFKIEKKDYFYYFIVYMNVYIEFSRQIKFNINQINKLKELKNQVKQYPLSQLEIEYQYELENGISHYINHYGIKMKVRAINILENIFKEKEEELKNNNTLRYWKGGNFNDKFIK